MEDKAIISAIIQQGVLPLFYHEESSVSLNTVKALYKAGIRVIEYTNRGDKALENFKSLLQERQQNFPELILGIGTVKSVSDAEQYLAAGADFIICPGTIPAVAAVVHTAGKLWIPGCMTTSEIIVAEQAGATLIKLFPGNLLGPSFVSSITDIFPKLLFMPTGGVDTTSENISEWYKAGVCAVGMGSKLVSKKMLQSEDYDFITALTGEVMQTIRTVKQAHEQTR